jgi:adenylylsulfate kinase
MTSSPENIHPAFDALNRRQAQEKRLGQKGHLYWFFGLSGAGKSTLAQAFGEQMELKGRYVVYLDGDNLRTGLNGNLGFSDEDRRENIRRTSELAKLLVENGAVVLASLITPRKELRDTVRRIVPGPDRTLIFVGASFETCRQRDVKGLYAKAAAGEVKDFTGKDSGFELPTEHEVTLSLFTDRASPTETLQELLRRLPTF